MLDTLPHLNQIGFPAIRRKALTTMQINLGYRCNLSCTHCHVAASPLRTEMMSPENIAVVINFLRASQVETLDLTGGAPELHPQFQHLVQQAHAMGIKVIDRCNLTVLEEEGQDQTAAFLAEHQVEIVASLPCYLQENVDHQRGNGVFATSIRVLQQLNEIGYGIEGSGLTLNLVYNPQGTNLPPNQQQLELAYKEQLCQRYGIKFNQLFTITNMPIQRFGSTLLSTGSFDAYMHQLTNTYQASNLETVMCRNTISIDWQGMVYDCDFNQMLKLPSGLIEEVGEGRNLHLSHLDINTIENAPIRVMDHCFGCTAGQGSSCGGALD
ncbi:MAG: arsenosugar biosynthesis radical SAM protein ArsS [Mariprofundales bacterium]|nr:arsenosugar biosynthesis radical SAM protein ArsS [Mariprofundales bacterium]